MQRHHAVRKIMFIRQFAAMQLHVIGVVTDKIEMQLASEYKYISLNFVKII